MLTRCISYLHNLYLLIIWYLLAVAFGECISMQQTSMNSPLMLALLAHLLLLIRKAVWMTFVSHGLLQDCFNRWTTRACPHQMLLHGRVRSQISL